MRVVGKPRRTNWLAEGPTYVSDDVAAGEVRNITLWNANDSSDELSKYVRPTLIRIRGQILVDQTMTASDPPVADFFHAYFALYYNQSAPLGSSDNLTWSSDHILWTDAAGSQLVAENQGTPAGYVVWSYHQNLVKLDVDVKAMRIIADTGTIGLHIENLSSGNDSFTFSYLFRALFKE